MNLLRRADVDLHYRVDGPDDAPAIIFSNSLGCDFRMWDAQVRALENRLRVIRYDTRGHGGSGLPRGPVSLPVLAGDVIALLDHLGIRRAHLCGLSLGGVTALWLAAHAPSRFKRAIFANTGAKVGTPEMWNARIEAIRTGGMESVRDAALERFLSSSFRARSPDIARKIAGMLESTPRDGYIACCEALRDADLRPDIASIQIPSLIIASELDVSTPPALSQDLHAAIAGSSLVVIPQTAHLSCVESADAFNDALLAFLDGDLR